MALADTFAAVAVVAVIVSAAVFAGARTPRRPEAFWPVAPPSCSHHWLYGRKGCGDGGEPRRRPAIDPPRAADLCCGRDWGPFGLGFTGGAGY